MKTTNLNLHRMITAVIAIAVTGVIMTGCSDNSTDTDFSSEFDVQMITTDSHGQVMADGEGNVLYFFTPDVEGESVCVDECIENWPAFQIGQPDPGEGLNPSDFGTVTRPDGGTQTTYKGWPLYYFVGDQQPGSVNGDGVENVWYAAKTGYSLMIGTGQLVGADGNNYTSDYEEGEEITSWLTDTGGNTLYIFSFDSANTNNCTDQCADNWPVFHTDIGQLPSAVSGQNFGEITVHGDRQQLTYKGWPLYYFAGDSERGQTGGVSVPEPGVWPVVQGDTPAAPGYEGNDDDNNNGDPPGY